MEENKSWSWLRNTEPQVTEPDACLTKARTPRPRHGSGSRSRPAPREVAGAEPPPVRAVGQSRFEGSGHSSTEQWTKRKGRGAAGRAQGLGAPAAAAAARRRPGGASCGLARDPPVPRSARDAASCRG